MAQLISEIWAGLCEAGLPEVMLYLADNSASRCHWDDTALIGGVRVALLADQDRQIVRILPVDSCVGIGIASPKGTDPSGYKRVVFNKLTRGPGDAAGEPGAAGDPPPPPDAAHVAAPYPAAPPPAPPGVMAMVMTPPPPPPEFAEPPPKPDPLASRWGVAMKPPAPARNGGR